MNWFDLMANPKSFYVKKYMAQFLGHKYPKHEQILERVCSVIVTDHDYEAFGKMITDIYEAAYLKAVRDHGEQLEKLGFKVSVVGEKVG